ncbi:MAG: type II secretion system F family protein [Phycisphaerae bacterium]|nr:type II secretion system F family protein [Phycisphaerae bacterium]
MATYQYEAMNSSGQEVQDEIEAPSQQEAVTRIRALGYFPTRLKEKGGRTQQTSTRAKKKARSITIGRVGAKQLTQFTRQLSTLQDAGLPILRSMRILESQTKPGVLKNALMDIVEDVEGGASLSEAMAKHPKAFESLYVHTVRAGEAGGVLPEILRKLAEFMEKARALKRRVVSAMVYPAAVILIAIVILIFIMLFIVPRFEKIFSSFDIPGGLPLPTQVLINVSRWLGSDFHWLIIPAIPLGGFILLKLIKASKGGRLFLDRAKLTIPIVGNIVNKTSVARFARTLGTLIGSGVPILDALNITRDTVGNEVIANALNKVHDSIREGESIAGPLKESRVVDQIVVNMVDVGEETGELDKMLVKVADNYDDEIDALVNGLVSALEPLMIVFLGGLIGGIVISLFLPIVKLLESVQQ